MEDPQPEMINVIGTKQGLISYSTDVKRYASPPPLPKSLRTNLSIRHCRKRVSFENGASTFIPLLQIATYVLRFSSTYLFCLYERLSFPWYWRNEGVCLLTRATELSSIL